MPAKVICPYLHENDTHIDNLKTVFGWKVPHVFTRDIGRIGSDLMYQQMWNAQKPHDVILWHTDMLPKDSNWYNDLLYYADKYPEAGIIGCLLLYPINKDGKEFVQCAGGQFDGLMPTHFGGGLDLTTNTAYKEPVEDNGQFDEVREVAWTTFGGCLIRRAVLDKISFDPTFQWIYNRDVDFCLQTRELGWKIYQVPVRLYHFESFDTRSLRDEAKAKMEYDNLIRLQNKWKDSPLYRTIDIEVK